MRKYFIISLCAFLFICKLSFADSIRKSALSNRSVAKSIVQTLTFDWPEFKRGDCHQIDGKLVLQADGKAHFSCVTWTDSTHSGDYWHAGFEFLDAQGVTLFHSPMGIGPRMDDGHPSPRYRWKFDFMFDLAIFSKVASVRQYCDC